ncbi:hypothetical protein LSAT2_027780 [Lamellibrachia satsuma]|nr:hypothetical protein LSAT2_027780 [Lamellibrachia satsuma]
MSGKVGGKSKELVPIGLTGDNKNGIALLVEDCQVSSLAQCLPRLSSTEVQLLRKENTLLFEVKSCSRIKVQLRNAHIHMVYQLDFASSTDENNIIRTVATKTTSRKKSQFTQDCSTMRQFWVKWANNVISGGIGFTPGTKEVMRQTDGSERYGKIVTLANLVTEPKDDNAEFTFYPASSQPVLDPPVPMEKAVQLNDANNDTCLVLAHTDMYTFSVSARRWAPQPRGKCVHPGLIIRKCVPDAIKASFTVMITGRHLVCSNAHIKVSIRHTKWPACETAGLYRICKLSETTGSGLGLTTCIAKCICEGDDCKHVTIHIPNLQEDWEVCEIVIE